MTNEKLTKVRVDRLMPPATGQAFFRDALLKGFGVRITAAGIKSFVVEKRVEGKVRRITLGKYPALTVEQARKEAQKLLGKIASGQNPIAQKLNDEMRRKTLGDTFDDFKDARKQLKPKTLYDYGRLIDTVFEDWKTRPLVDITKDMVARRHAKIGGKNGEAHANLAMRFLRALFNFAIAEYEDGFGHPLLAQNPVVRITQTRAWYRVERRQTVIKAHQLPAWYEAVEALKKPTNPKSTQVADYLLLLLLTGLRRQEAAMLRWEDVDLKAKTMRIPDTKNHEPLTLPISDTVLTLLEGRQTAQKLAEKALAEKQAKTGEDYPKDALQVAGGAVYVFPGPSEHGAMQDPRADLDTVRSASGVSFTLHDLRRTFITIAESLDIPMYAIKRLVNHKMSGDVTAGYIVTDVERLRAPMQRITDYIMTAAKARPTADVVQLRQAS